MSVGLLILRLVVGLRLAAHGAQKLVAAVSVHIEKGFFAHNGGYEYTLVLARKTARPSAAQGAA